LTYPEKKIEGIEANDTKLENETSSSIEVQQLNMGA